ncbi:hypothetical protein KQX54_013375 [Cotesia glomerata]|uniref:Uncharacterized protein n=1 Tax=Cotesia glomerata TaxID=32391 RepID=A0AAV7J1I6_COTGL|nr:hypothetical protein KQX54_013375 [Cotesia glomerata]
MVESGNPEPFERLAVPQTQGHCPWGFNDPHEERDVSTRWCAMSRSRKLHVGKYVPEYVARRHGALPHDERERAREQCPSQESQPPS